MLRVIGAVLCLGMSLGRAQEWTEAQIVAQFESQSPQARELKARVAVVEAEARARVVRPNPSASYSREGAGYAEFFELSQTLPISGRLRYVKDAGSAAVAVADADREALLWSLRGDLRIAFYRMLAAQERVRLLTASAGDVEQWIQVLRRREEEGEGSRYDRLRAEREVAELRIDATGARALIAASAARLAGFLPEGAVIARVSGDLQAGFAAPPLEELYRRALASRAEYRVELRRVNRWELEEQAARRLRVPEPTVTAGVKRGNTTSINPLSEGTRTGVVFGISVPLSVFNRGQYEVSRYQAEQEQTRARMATLARQIRAEVQGAREVLAIRQEALEAYQRELRGVGTELTGITRIAYQEGEVGILELLDSLRVNRVASLRLLDLQAGVREAVIELERVVGEEVRP